LVVNTVARALCTGTYAGRLLQPEAFILTKPSRLTGHTLNRSTNPLSL